MEFTSQVIPRQSMRDKYVLYRVSNQNGMEIVCSGHRAAVLSIRLPDSRGRLSPLLPHYRENIESYSSSSIIFGAIQGPISFPYTETSILVKRKNYSLPTMEDRKRFRLMGWATSIRCVEQSCKIIYNSVSVGHERAIDNTAARRSSSAHTVKIELTRQNQLFTYYSSRSTNKEFFSLGHNIAWNVGTAKDMAHYQLTINADQVTETPFVKELVAVEESGRDYRKERAVEENCTGYYRINEQNVTNAQHEFGRRIDSLMPAVMLSNLKTKHYVQIYTDYPCLQVSFHRHAQKKQCAISFVPCVLLDMPALFTDKLDQTFCCCYQFGTFR